jgi:hypothetical protein
VDYPERVERRVLFHLLASVDLHVVVIWDRKKKSRMYLSRDAILRPAGQKANQRNSL